MRKCQESLISPAFNTDRESLDCEDSIGHPCGQIDEGEGAVFLWALGMSLITDVRTPSMSSSWWRPSTVQWSFRSSKSYAFPNPPRGLCMSPLILPTSEAHIAC